jgi:hypothetical protein
MRPNASAAFRNFEQEARQSAVWDSDQNATSSSGDNLASLYRPPFSLMFNGPFDKVSFISVIRLISLHACENVWTLFCCLHIWKTAQHITATMPISQLADEFLEHHSYRAIISVSWLIII